MKTLEELINLEEPGWDLVQEWLKNAKNKYEILPKDKQRAEKELLNAQVSTHSSIGAIIYETGGILIDNGWLRILGSGNPKLDRGLSEWNKGKTFENYGDKPSHFLIADDVLGGYFAINGGEIGDEIGNIYYLPQDILKWESLECGYSDFLYWAFNGDLNLFYKSFRWKNWKEDILQVNGNQVFSFFPFLWTEEVKNIEKISKRIIPIEESYSLTLDFQRKLSKK